MSVVNRMLKDLENRKSDDNISADYVPSQGSKFTKYIASAVIVLVASVTLVIAYDRYVIPEGQDTTPASQTQPLKDNEQIASAKPEAVASEKNTDEDVAVFVESEEKRNREPTSTEVSSLGVVSGSMLAAEQNKAGVNQTALTTAAVIQTVEVDQSASDLGSYQQEAFSVQDNSMPADAAAMMVSENAENTAQDEQDLPVNSIVVQPSSGQQPQVARLREQARIALEDKRVNSAMNALKELLSIAPMDVEARKQLASIQFASQQVAAAFNTLQLGINAAPNDSSMRLMQSRIAFRQGDKELAFAVLRGLPDESQASDEFLSFRAALAENNSEYAVAYNDYRRLLQRYPDNAKWWLGLAIAQDKLSMSSGALAAYRQVQSLDQLSDGVRKFVDERIQVLARQS